MLSFDVSQIRALILDMDGVVWKMYQPLVDLPVVFTRIRESGYKVILATNNSTKTPARYLELLEEFGVKLAPWQVINSSEATASYLRQQHPKGGLVHVVGEEGLHRALEVAGFRHGDGESGGEVLAVVAGMERNIDYDKIASASLLIRAGASFVGTNPDKTFPSPYGQLPGAGTILAALEAASGVAPVVIGKPRSGMYEVALERLGTSPQETLVVGDRLETDIAGAQNMDCYSALVLSGVTSLAAAQDWSPKPDIIAEDLNTVLDILASET